MGPGIHGRVPSYADSYAQRHPEVGEKGEKMMPQTLMIYTFISKFHKLFTINLNIFLFKIVYRDFYIEIFKFVYRNVSI